VEWEPSKIEREKDLEAADKLKRCRDLN